MNHFKKFSLSYLGFLTFFIVVIVGFNWLINPYNLFSPSFTQLAKKPMVTSHLRLVKARAIEWKKPDIIFLGSSTAETGFNPHFLKCWNKSTVYNLGLSGANIYEVTRYLQHAQSVKPLKQVVLLINFFMFNAYLSNRDDFNESFLKVDSQGNENSLSINNLLSTLLSYDAVKDSIETIKNQNTQNAFKEDGQLIHNYRKTQVNQLKGYRNNFLYTESYAKTSFFPPPQQKFDFINSEKHINTFDTFQKIISLCEQHNTKLIIILAPEHVRLLETYKLLGIWKLYEKWQREITKLVERHNLNYPNLTYSLWSFNKINQLTMEQLPKKDDNDTEMKWFWDPYHFKNQLGNLILSIVINKKELPNLSNIATLLTLNNLPNELKKTNAQLAIWEKNHPEDISELKIPLN